MDLNANSNVKMKMISYWEVETLNVLQEFQIKFKNRSGVIPKEVIRYPHVLQNQQAGFQIDMRLIFDWLRLPTNQNQFEIRSQKLTSARCSTLEMIPWRSQTTQISIQPEVNRKRICLFHQVKRNVRAMIWLYPKMTNVMDFVIAHHVKMSLFKNASKSAKRLKLFWNH